MTEQEEKRLNSADLSSADSNIAGKSISFYWNTSKYFIVLLVILEIINVIFDLYTLGRWAIVVLISLLFTLWLARQSRVKLAAAAAANVFLGIVAGLALAIFDVIWYHQWWYILNIIRIPFILGLIGFVASIIFYLLFRSILIRKQHKDVSKPLETKRSSTKR